MSFGRMDQQKVSSVAEWERKSSNRSTWLNSSREEEDRRAAEAAELDRKRVMLAEKLCREEQQLNRELLEKQEAVATRRTALVDKAKQKEEQREAQRQRLAEQLRELQFKESCDALRTKQSQQQQRNIAEEQKFQALERGRLQYEETAKDREIDQLALSQDARKIAEHEDQMQKKQEEFLKIKAMLDSQVAEREKKAALGAEAQRCEIQEMHSTWKQAEEAAKAMEQQAILRKAELNQQMRLLNEQRQADFAVSRAAERQADQDRLATLLQHEAEATAKEQDAKQRRKEADLLYRRHLEASLLREVGDSAEKDALLQQAKQVQLAKEDAHRAAAEAARTKLMKEVTEGRRDQIQQRALSKEHIVGERKVELERLQQESIAAAAAEEAKREELRREEIRYRMALQVPVAEKQQRLAQEKSAAAKEAEEAKRAEEAFQEKVAKALGTFQPRTDFRRKKLEW